MEAEATTQAAAPSPNLDTCVKTEMVHDVLETQQRPESVLARTGMTPSRHDSERPWIPFPLGQPVIPEAEAITFDERRLDPQEWVELLEQTECLEYVSPDVEACIERQSRMEGNQELDLTGREFIDSPFIPMLPPLSTIDAERTTVLKPIAQPQHNVPRRPGLREKFPRQQPLSSHNQARFPDNYSAAADPAETTKTVKRSSSAAKRSSERPPARSASRSLRFEVPQQANASSRRKRASWSGQSTQPSTPAPYRRQCKSARKSKDCVIPGCTKGARSKGLCKRHGGGKRCTFPDCGRSDQGGGFCIAHGGGKRCATEGCKNSAQSRGLCKSHGGGKRCRAAGCAKSSQEGGYCRGHRAGKAEQGEAFNILL